jgi:hypothetical protein
MIILFKEDRGLCPELCVKLNFPFFFCLISFFPFFFGDRFLDWVRLNGENHEYFFPCYQWVGKRLELRVQTGNKKKNQQKKISQTQCFALLFFLCFV